MVKRRDDEKSQPPPFLSDGSFPSAGLGVIHCWCQLVSLGECASFFVPSLVNCLEGQEDAASSLSSHF